MATQYSWERGPFNLIKTPTFLDRSKQKDEFAVWATHMALIHNAWIRALNGLYVAAPNVPKSDYANFVGYASRVYISIQRHHDEEEELVFPIIEKMTGAEGLMSVNVEQHEAFEKAFDAWGAYLKSLLEHSTTAEFSSEKFCNLINEFCQPLQLHLEEEIHTLEKMNQYSHVDMKVLGKELHEAVMARMSFAVLRDDLPVLMLNHDATYEEGLHAGFPPMPALLSFAIRRLATFWSAGYWKYATCSTTQQPKDLPGM